MYRIGLDYTPAWEQFGGIGRYARELTASLALLDQENCYRLFVAGASAGTLPPPLAHNHAWRPTGLSPKWLARIWQRARIPLPVEFFTGRINLFHATDFVLPPTLPATRTLLTVHDLSFVRVPAAASPSLKAYLDVVVPRSVALADHILADSSATKDDLVELYRTPAEKISVLYSGVDQRFRRVKDKNKIDAVLSKYGLNGISFVLSVGTIQPRKNYPRVIEALAGLRASGNALHYVIAGGKGWLENEMHDTIARTGLDRQVHLLGLVDEEDLPALYSAARMIMAASLYEGFGLPVLEAMACGVPVVTSNLSSLPEVAGDAAILVDPLNVNAIRDAMRTLDQDVTLRDHLVRSGYDQAASFTWARSATRLLEIYRNLLVD